jgi:hypothetical protein
MLYLDKYSNQVEMQGSYAKSLLKFESGTGVSMDYLSLVVCCVCAVSVSELLVTPNNLKFTVCTTFSRI